MTTALENQMPDPAAMRFQCVATLDGMYTDYHWEQITPEGRRIEWELTHDLSDDTWMATIDDQEATQAQVEVLLRCLTEEQRADSAEEVREQRAATADDEPAPLAM